MSSVVTAALTLASAARGADTGAPRQVLELRTYRFASEPKLQAFASFLAEAYIPALNRAGVAPVGVFRVTKADNAALNLEADELVLRVLLPHADLASVLALPGRLAADAALAPAAAAVLGTPQSDPVYERFETQLLLSFEACPQVEVPTTAATRVLQLRIYESHNDERALRKIEMFNQGGEIALFRRLGMAPVFFGQSIAGTALPNLTYMLGFASPAALESAWASFRADSEWARLKVEPRYADTVSRITNLILRPLPGSQI